MQLFMDQVLNLDYKDDGPSYGIYKISLEEVADTLEYIRGFGCNKNPYYRTLHELTNKYLVESKEFITSDYVNDRILFKTSFYNKHALPFLAMLCKKHGKRNWLDNERLMRDHKIYLNRIIGITDRKLVEDSSEDSEGYAPGGDSDDSE